MEENLPHEKFVHNLYWRREGGRLGVLPIAAFQKSQENWQWKAADWPRHHLPICPIPVQAQAIHQVLANLAHFTTTNGNLDRKKGKDSTQSTIKHTKPWVIIR